MSSSRARAWEANPMSPSGRPTTTEKSIRAKIALRQSSVFFARNAPATRAPVATTGAIAWNGRVVRRARPRTPALRASTNPIPAKVRNSAGFESRFGRSATSTAPTTAPHRLLRPPRTTPSRNTTVSSYTKTCGCRYWKLNA